MIEDDVEQVLDCYFKACSISVNSKDLAHIGFVLANRGKLPQTEERIFPSRYATYVNAILMTCGMYDGSGDFAVNVGVPGQKWSGRRHYGCGAHQNGNRYLFPWAGWKGKQPGRY